MSRPAIFSKSPQIKANIVPVIGDQAWAKGVFEVWDNKQIQGSRRAAIA